MPTTTHWSLQWKRFKGKSCQLQRFHMSFFRAFQSIPVLHMFLQECKKYLFQLFFVIMSSDSYIAICFRCSYRPTIIVNLYFNELHVASQYKNRNRVVQYDTMQCWFHVKLYVSHMWLSSLNYLELGGSCVTSGFLFLWRDKAVAVALYWPISVSHHQISPSSKQANIWKLLVDACGQLDSIAVGII